MVIIGIRCFFRIQVPIFYRSHWFKEILLCTYSFFQHSLYIRLTPCVHKTVSFMDTNDNGGQRLLNYFSQGFKVPFKLYWDAGYEKIMEAYQNYTSLQIDYWFQYVLGRWFWWFLLFWTIFPLLVWWKYTDRNRFLEISFFGLFISLCAGILDAVGSFLGLWAYPYQLLPCLPNLFPIDYVVIPVVFMLIYQKYTGWTEFLIASTVVSAVLSLILDPILVWMNLYQPLTWQYYYSVPTFILMVSFCKGVTLIAAGQDSKYGG